MRVVISRHIRIRFDYDSGAYDEVINDNRCIKMCHELIHLYFILVWHSLPSVALVQFTFLSTL